MANKRGRMKWMIPDLQNEIANIMEESRFNGHGSESLAQKKATEYCQVGRKVEKMFGKMTMGIYKDRRKPKDIL